MEAAGIAIGVASLVGLFSDCLECYHLIQCGAAIQKDYTILATKIRNQELRFVAWGRACGLCEDGAHDNRLNDALLRERVVATMKCIVDLFCDAEELNRRYGLQLAPSLLNTKQRQQLLADTEGQAVTSGIKWPIGSFFRRRKKLKGFGIRDKALWAINDREKLSNLIQHLKDFNDDLEDMTKATSVPQIQRHIVECEIKEVDDIRDLEEIAEASTDDWDVVSDVASVRLERITEGSISGDDCLTIASGYTSLTYVSARTHISSAIDHSSLSLSRVIEDPMDCLDGRVAQTNRPQYIFSSLVIPTLASTMSGLGGSKPMSDTEAILLDSHALVAAESDMDAKTHRKCFTVTDVRKHGACLPCRVLKIRCSESGVCPTCRKAFPNHEHLVCNRNTLGMSWPVLEMAPNIWSQNAAAEQVLRFRPRLHFGVRRKIAVFLEDPRQFLYPRMQVVVQAYAYSREGTRGGGSPDMVSFPSDAMPSHNQLQRWVEKQFECERTTEFPSAVQTFLFKYANEGHGLPKHDLVSNVHQMNCFFRILKTPVFWCRDQENKTMSLPLSAQAELKSIACSALHCVEHDVLKKLDECMKQGGAPKEEERIAIWACMWQLMLLYREVQWDNRKYIYKAAGYEADAGSIDTAWNFHYKLMQSFFPLLMMFYHYHFRMKKSIELSLDWLQESLDPSEARRRETLFDCLQDINDSRIGFYKQLQASPLEAEQLLAVFVVEHEIKKLYARKRRSVPQHLPTISKALGDSGARRDNKDPDLSLGDC